jgi:dTDP-4-dehydrorhamnose reductase
MIGHELSGSRSLVSWFMSQKVRVRGFRRAIFSGLPTVEIGRVLKQFVLPNTNLKGLYHLSANPINKFDLLSLVAQTYGKSIEVIPDDTLLVDRSLDSSRFRALTGYTPKSWPDLVLAMRNFG